MLEDKTKLGQELKSTGDHITDIDINGAAGAMYAAGQDTVCNILMWIFPLYLLQPRHLQRFQCLF